MRTYDAPRTPYQRVLDSGVLSSEKTEELSRVYEQTNPAELMRQIVKLQCRLLELAKGPSDVEMKHEQFVKTLLEEVA
ncbi:hypothetical protein FACS189481_5750 [Clostridia bacterium]|nr:hypothetical protein FACS189481_5750 [Clostridia bacterium]